MPISTKHIADATNTEILDQTNPKLDVAISAAKIYTELKSSVFSVPDEASLPPVGENTGRLIWVESLLDYRYSDGIVWTRDYSSTAKTDDKIFYTGDNTASTPTVVSSSQTQWDSISAGSYHNLAISNGTAWGWGYNGNGPIGDGTTFPSQSPVSVVGGFTDWCQVSAGYRHSIGLRADGTTWAWGQNTLGQLGDGTAINKSSPVSVVGGFTDWCQVSSGALHSLGIRADGTAWAWGDNFAGRLGDNTTIAKSSPVSVVGGFTDWCQISAGVEHSVSVRTNGTIWSWGNSFYGQLGDGATVSTSSPVSVTGGFTDWCKVSAGGYHTSAIRTNGTVWSWGRNTEGQLGDGTSLQRNSPVAIIGGFTDVCAIDAGKYHSSAIRTNGTAWTWGSNLNGQLGDGTYGTNAAKASPVSMVGGITSWGNVAAGQYLTLFVAKKNMGF